MRLYPLLKRNYELIDPIIQRWASEESLQLFTEYKDEEIRSVRFCSDGETYGFRFGLTHSRMTEVST